MTIFPKYIGCFFDWHIYLFWYQNRFYFGRALKYIEKPNKDKFLNPIDRKSFGCTQVKKQNYYDEINASNAFSYLENSFTKNEIDLILAYQKAYYQSKEDIDKVLILL